MASGVQAERARAYKTWRRIWGALVPWSFLKVR
jgi:hypothetical protein